MNLELHNIKEWNSPNLAEIQNNIWTCKKTVGLNIYTIQYIFQGIMTPRNSIDRRKLVFNW